MDAHPVVQSITDRILASPGGSSQPHVAQELDSLTHTLTRMEYQLSDQERLAETLGRQSQQLRADLVLLMEQTHANLHQVFHQIDQMEALVAAQEQRVEAFEEQVACVEATSQTHWAPHITSKRWIDKFSNMRVGSPQPFAALSTLLSDVSKSATTSILASPKLSTSTTEPPSSPTSSSLSPRKT
ncbi:hypothetical protein IWQ62_003616 [Dispira parvispora]|uniref:Uncharacterized protein n=1 Tax=Dispira parvispora TaxID=1520584 RepID=A0A9W8E6W7_9FUNG|nr:hypothetical protein IWQ62_003616 [Dispira parvispora]